MRNQSPHILLVGVENSTATLEDSGQFLKIFSIELPCDPASWSIQAAITKNYKLSGLFNTHVFLTFLDAVKSKFKALTDSVSVENPLLPYR